MERLDRIYRYEQACEFLPHRLKSLALSLPDKQKERVEELRLKPLWQELLRAEVFRRCVVIRANGGARSYEVSALPCSA